MVAKSRFRHQFLFSPFKPVKNSTGSKNSPLHKGRVGPDRISMFSSSTYKLQINYTRRFCNFGYLQNCLFLSGFQLGFQTYKNFCTYIFSNPSRFLIKVLAIFCSMQFFCCIRQTHHKPFVTVLTALMNFQVHSFYT